MATLKISELSGGDWVNYENKAYRLYAIEECGLLRGKCESNEDLAHIAKHIDYFEPIPITPEILEKNGWKKEGRSYRWSNEKYRVFIWLKKSSHVVDVVEMDMQFATKTSCIEVSQLYVHQLQHAMRLAGVDKEINL